MRHRRTTTTEREATTRRVAWLVALLSSLSVTWGALALFSPAPVDALVVGWEVPLAARVVGGASAVVGGLMLLGAGFRVLGSAIVGPLAFVFGAWAAGHGSFAVAAAAVLFGGLAALLAFWSLEDERIRTAGFGALASPGAG